VTSVPGTTRDILELSLDIGGLPVIVSDTAGLRKTSDIVETIGVERATKAFVISSISSAGSHFLIVYKRQIFQSAFSPSERY
jgi:tRNA U34 5-carboxymethylaminomethyl modifying GTPase MnmE/TrmE